MIITVYSTQEIIEAASTLSSRWMIFKHSDTCPISTTAIKQLQQMSAAHPEVTVLMLEVKSQRDLSDRIAKEYETKHESPQVLIFNWNKLKEVKNHLAISARWLIHVVNNGYVK